MQHVGSVEVQRDLKRFLILNRVIDIYILMIDKDLNRATETRQLLIAFRSRQSALEYEIAIEITRSRVD